MIPAVAFAIGLVFGLTFDTTGPRSAKTKGVPAAGAQRPVATDGNGTAEDRRVQLDEGDTTADEQEAGAEDARAGEEIVSGCAWSRRCAVGLRRTRG